jgi:hypothetical protein
MGYRSQVAIAIGNDHLETFKSRLQENDLEGADVIENSDCTVYFWDSVKWYLSFKDVERIEHAMHFLHERDLNFEFRRVGEECDDIVDICSGDHERWTFISTSIGIH